MSQHDDALAAWRAAPTAALAAALDALDVELPDPLPDLDTPDALAPWLAAARTGDAAQLGRLLEPLVAALELDPPQDEASRKTWRRAMSEAIQALAPFSPDPRLSFALMCIARRVDSNDLYCPDEAAHVVAPEPQLDRATRPPSLGAALVAAIARTADPRVPDWLRALTDGMAELDCNGAQLRDDLVALEATLRATAARPAVPRKIPEAMPSALRRRIDLAHSTETRVRLRPGARLTPGAWADRGPDLLAWPGWARVTELELAEFLPLENLLDGRLKALSGVFGLGDWEAASLLYQPRPLQTLAVRAPSLSRDDDDEPLPEPPLDDAPPSAAAAEEALDIPIELYDHLEPVEAEWIDAQGEGAAFEAMAAGNAFESEPAPEPELNQAAEPAPFETMGEAILRGKGLPGLETLRVSLHDGGRHASARPERFRWLWQRRLGQQIRTLGVVAESAEQVRAWWDEGPRLPDSIRCIELFQCEPVVANPDGFVIVLVRLSPGPFSEWGTRGPDAGAATMVANLPPEPF